MASPAARRVSSHAGSKARLGQTIRREGREVSPASIERHLVIAQRKIVGQANALAAPAGQPPVASPVDSNSSAPPSSSRIRRVAFESAAGPAGSETGISCGSLPAVRKMVGASGERHCALLAALDRLAKCSRSNRVSTPSDRRIAVSKLRGGMMLLAPDIPVVGLDAPGAGGLLDLAIASRWIWPVLSVPSCRSM